MTETELDAIKLCLTCGISAYGNQLLNSLSLGTCVDSKVDNITLAGFLLDTLCRYSTESSANAITEDEACEIINKIKYLIS